MNWLKRRFQEWLGIYKIRRDYDLIMRSLNVGTDVYLTTRSWAVICLDGNPCYIKFFDLPKGEIVGIRNFLKQYTRANKYIDSPIPFIFE